MAANRRRRGAEPTDEWGQLELLCAWPEQRDYELIRPMVLFGSPASERRLASDLLRVMRGERFDPARLWGGFGADIVEDFTQQFDGFELRDMGGLAAADHEARCIIAVHPLEETELSRTSERIAEAAVEAGAEGYQEAGDRRLSFADYFDGPVTSIPGCGSRGSHAAPGAEAAGLRIPVERAPPRAVLAPGCVFPRSRVRQGGS